MLFDGLHHVMQALGQEPSQWIVGVAALIRVKLAMVPVVECAFGQSDVEGLEAFPEVFAGDDDPAMLACHRTNLGSWSSGLCWHSPKFQQGLRCKQTRVFRKHCLLGKTFQLSRTYVQTYL